ncbi:MAG: hypothetical protein ACO3XL_12740 [Gemmobacter sp.]
MTDYYFDVTGLIAYLRRNDRYSGIQRVVAMMIDRCAREVGAERVHICFDTPFGGYRTVSMRDMPEGIMLEPKKLKYGLRLGRPRPEPIRALARYHKEPANTSSIARCSTFRRCSGWSTVSRNSTRRPRPG